MITMSALLEANITWSFRYVMRVCMQQGALRTIKNLWLELALLDCSGMHTPGWWQQCHALGKPILSIWTIGYLH